MECKIDPKLPYTDLSTMIHRQRQVKVIQCELGCWYPYRKHHRVADWFTDLILKIFGAPMSIQIYAGTTVKIQNSCHRFEILSRW